MDGFFKELTKNTSSEQHLTVSTYYSEVRFINSNLSIIPILDPFLLCVGAMNLLSHSTYSWYI